MNAKNIIKALTTYSNNVSDIEHMIVYAFIKKENIKYDNSDMLKDYVSELDDALCVKAVELFSKTDMMLSMESIVELLEQIVPEGEKKEKGIVYTPLSLIHIRRCRRS